MSDHLFYFHDLYFLFKGIMQGEIRGQSLFGVKELMAVIFLFNSDKLRNTFFWLYSQLLGKFGNQVGYQNLKIFIIFYLSLGLIRPGGTVVEGTAGNTGLYGIIDCFDLLCYDYLVKECNKLLCRSNHWVYFRYRTCTHLSCQGLQVCYLHAKYTVTGGCQQSFVLVMNTKAY